jgi:hypothetical protein
MGRKTKLMARSLQLLQSRGPGEYKKALDVRVCSHLGSKGSYLSIDKALMLWAISCLYWK